MILDYLDGDAAAALFAEIHGAELDALVAEITARLRRLDAAGMLDDDAAERAEAELLRRAATLAERFFAEYLDAAVAADTAVGQARPKALRKWIRPKRMKWAGPVRRV